MSRCILLVSFLLAACGGGGSGATSGTLTAPQSLVAIASSESVALSWKPVPGATGYSLSWWTSASSPVRIDGVVAPFRHTGLVNGTAYRYTVSALDGVHRSAPSSEARATPKASAADYDPAWASAASTRTLSFDRDAQKTDSQNGALLKAALLALLPGDRLEIGTGVYSIDSLLNLDLQGTAQAPIWIVAKGGAKPVLTRANANQNAINAGVGSQTRYVCLRGLTITGGDTGLKLYACQHLWLDQCHIHDTGGVGVAANSFDTDHLYITRNEIHGTAGTGEGLYLGANWGAWAMSDSVIALNHVHDTGGEQGDGIEIKQGSYGNLVAENVVHDTHQVCILLYGTGGKAINRVEKNVCWGSDDNVMQVQGEALVRNNLLMRGAYAFGCHDHQGSVTDLVVVENTMINAGQGALLTNWDGRAGMVFANNVVYSEGSLSIAFDGGSSGVTIAGNVVVGAVSGASGGWRPGVGLADFAAVAWDASRRDATPSATSAILGSGDPAWQSAEDLGGAPRTGSVEAGCYDRP